MLKIVQMTLIISRNTSHMDTTNQKTYSEAIARLEEIVGNIENDNPDVDELSKLAEEAIELINYCKDKLNGADKKLQDLMQKLG